MSLTRQAGAGAFAECFLSEKRKNIKLELGTNIIICFGFEVKKITTLGRLSGLVG